MDVVWGYGQAELEEETQRLLACVTRSSISYPLVGTFGPRPFPAIFQGHMNHKFGNLTDPSSLEPGRKICTVALDDLKINSKSYPHHLIHPHDLHIPIR